MLKWNKNIYRIKYSVLIWFIKFKYYKIFKLHPSFYMATVQAL
jgi:hypothetical protein